MIKLETEFVSGEGGFSSDPLTYQQVCRTDKVAVYVRSRDGVVKDYEVFNIHIRPKGLVIFGKVTEDDTECYPSTGQFGKTAWSCNKKERAIQLYDELCIKVANGLLIQEAIELEALTNESSANQFTVGEYAIANGLDYNKASQAVKAGVESGTIKFVREERRHAKGKPSKIYVKA